MAGGGSTRRAEASARQDGNNRPPQRVLLARLGGHMKDCTTPRIIRFLEAPTRAPHLLRPRPDRPALSGTGKSPRNCRLCSEGHRRHHRAVEPRGLRCSWIAVRPRSHRDQARDLIAGIAHEKALVGDGQDGTRLVGSTAALNLALGCPMEMWVRAAVKK